MTIPEATDALQFVQYNPAIPEHTAYAQAICEATQGQDMLELSMDTIGAMPAYYFAFLGNTLVGGRGLTIKYSDRLHELGGLVSTVRDNRDFKGLRIGTKISQGVLNLVTEQYPDSEFIVVSNSISAHLQEKQGGQRITNPGEIPPEVFDFCAGRITAANPEGRKCNDYEKACAIGQVCCEYVRGGGFYLFASRNSLISTVAI